MKFRDRQHRTMILGVDAQWPAINKTGVDRGRFYSRVLGGITAMVGGIVGIALLVGGIGIMNIMLV